MMRIVRNVLWAIVWILYGILIWFVIQIASLLAMLGFF